MRWSRDSWRWLIAATVLVALAAVGGLVALLVRLGLDEADQLASVMGLFIGMAGTTAAVAAIAQNRPATRLARAATALPPPPPVRDTAWGPHALSEELVRLLTATRQAADTLPNPLLKERRTQVSTVYVRQRVEQPHRDRIEKPQPPRKGRTGRKQDLFLPMDQQPRVIPVRRPFAKAFDQHRHLLLEGGPGSGKSTTARQVCRQLAAAWLDGDPTAREMTAEPLLPLLVSARALAEHVGLVRWPEAIALAARSELGALAHLDVSAELLEKPVDGIGWLVVVDGLDEVPAQERDALLATLAGRTSTADQTYRLLITTRPLTGHATAVLGSATVGHYTLVPFDQAALTEFARRWFTEDDGTIDGDLAAGFLAEVTASGLEEVASVPLMATIAICVYEEDDRHTLPRNRHDLYENYLSQLRRSSHRRRTDARLGLAAVLASEPDGAHTATALYDRLDDLLESLAVVRVDTRDSLLAAALSRLSSAAVPSNDPVPLDWANHVTEALTTTGLVSPRGTGLDFIHLSFAEHLAARVYARDLPERFDPADDEWRRWLYLGKRNDPVALRVISSWTRDHRDQGAPELLDWLLAALREHRMLAVRLIAEGTTATASQLAKALDVLRLEVSGSRGLRSQTYVSLARRFPPKDCVREWVSQELAQSEGRPAYEVHLARLAADLDPPRRAAMVARITAVLRGDAPIPDRLIAASALHQLAFGNSDVATGVLRDLLRDSTIDFEDRVTVAVRLLEREDDTRPEALELLAGAMRDRALPPGTRRVAAEALAEADGDRRAEVIEQLGDALADPRADRDTVATIAETLIAIDPGNASAPMERLWEVVRDPLSEHWDIATAVRVLSTLGPATRHSLAAALLGMVDRPTTDWDLTISVGTWLAGLSDESRPQAVTLMCAYHQRDEAVADGFVAILRQLAYLEPGMREEVAAHLLPLVTDTSRSRLGRIAAAIEVAELSPRHQELADEAVEALLTPPLSSRSLSTAVTLLPTMSSAAATRVASALLDVLQRDDIDEPTFPSAAHQISSSVPEYATMAADVIESLIQRRVRRRVDLFHAMYPALQEADRERIGIRTLIRESHNRALGPEHQISALMRLRQFGPQTEAVAETFREVSNAVTDTLRFRGAVAATSPPWLPEARNRRLCVATEALDNPLIRPLDRISMWQTAMELADEHVERGTAELRRLAALRHLGTGVRVTALAALLAHRYVDQHEVRVDLLSLLSSAHASVEDRCHAAETLAGVCRPPHRAAIEAGVAGLDEDNLRLETGDGDGRPRFLVRICPGRPDLARIVASTAVARGAGRPTKLLLTRLDPESVERMTLADDLRTATFDTIDLYIAQAESTVQLTPGRFRFVTAALHRWLRQPDLRPGQRLAILDQLVEHDLTETPGAVGHLRAGMTAVSRRTPAPLDAIACARTLYHRFVTERPAAGAMLRAVADDPAESNARRVSARRVLLASGGPRALEAAADATLAVVRDERRSITDRCAAASNLNNLWWDGVAECRLILRSLLADRSTLRTGRNAFDLVAIAQTLITIGADEPTAVATMCALVEDPAVPGAAARSAVEFLVEDEFHDLSGLVDVLRRRLADGAGIRDRVWLLEALASLMPEAHPEAVAELATICHDPAAPPLIRIEAARALLPFGEYAVDGQTTLITMLCDRTVPGHLRVRAGRHLVAQPGPYAGRVQEELLTLPGCPAYRVDAAGVLMAFPGETADRAAAVLRELARQSGTGTLDRLRAVSALARHIEPASQRCAAEVLRRLECDESLHPALRYQVWVELAQVEFARADAVARRLWQVLDAEGSDLDHRRWAAEALGELDDGLRRAARDALAAYDHELLDPRARRRLRRSVATVDG